MQVTSPSHKIEIVFSGAPGSHKRLAGLSTKQALRAYIMNYWKRRESNIVGITFFQPK